MPRRIVTKGVPYFLLGVCGLALVGRVVEPIWEKGVEQGIFPEFVFYPTRKIAVENESDKAIKVTAFNEEGQRDAIGTLLPDRPRGVLFPGEKLVATLGGGYRRHYRSEPTFIKEQRFFIELRVCRGAPRESVSDINERGICPGQSFPIVEEPIQVLPSDSVRDDQFLLSITGNEKRGYTIGKCNVNSGGTPLRSTFKALLPFTLKDLSAEHAGLNPAS